MRLWWVTTGAVAVDARRAGGGGARRPVWGLGRTVMQEQPGARLHAGRSRAGRRVDSRRWCASCRRARGEPGGVARGPPARGAAGAGRRDGGRATAAHSQRKARVLITGGLGALGLHVARWLAQGRGGAPGAHGRRGLDTPGAAEAVAELEALGARVTVAAVDVADREALGARARGDPAELPLRGVVHAAGVLDDGVLAEQTAERFARVLSPKVAGAWHLHELTAGLELDFFVLFSSVAGLLGSPGQGNYAAANTFLDALAAHRRAQRACRRRAWRGGRGPKAAWRPGSARRSRPVWPARGWERCRRRRHRAVRAGAVAAGGAARGGAARSCGRCGRAFGATVPPVWRALVRAPRGARGGRRARRRGPRGSRAAAGAPRRGGARGGASRGGARAVAGAASAVPADRPLKELGLDSLMAVELRNALGQRVGKPLPATLAFDYPTVDALTRWLLDEVLAVTEPPAHGAEGIAAARPRRAHRHRRHRLPLSRAA